MHLCTHAHTHTHRHTHTHSHHQRSSERPATALLTSSPFRRKEKTEPRTTTKRREKEECERHQYSLSLDEHLRLACVDLLITPVPKLQPTTHSSPPIARISTVQHTRHPRSLFSLSLLPSRPIHTVALECVDPLRFSPHWSAAASPPPNRAHPPDPKDNSME